MTFATERQMVDLVFRPIMSTIIARGGPKWLSDWVHNDQANYANIVQVVVISKEKRQPGFFSF